MKQLKLTNANKVAIVDDADYAVLTQYNWYLKKSGYCWYVVRGVRNEDKISTIRLSRYLLKPADNLEVHHKNHNTLDNQRHNLLVCTKQENIKYNYAK